MPDLPHEESSLDPLPSDTASLDAFYATLA